MKKKKKIIVLVLLLLLTTGCATQLKDSDGKTVKNPTTGQTLTKNILCRPKDSETLSLYEANIFTKKESNDNVEDVENDVKESETESEDEKYFKNLPECEDFSITSGGYDGLWSSVIVKPLAWVIIQFGNILKNYGLGLIVTSLLIRLVAFPLTRKTALQSELMKEAKPKLDRLEKKYAGKTDQQSMYMKSNEMMAIYREYKINPLAGCLFALIQIPLFIGFLESINRVPAIFEENLLFIQLGTTPMTGITNGNFAYIILSVIVGVTTYFSLTMNSASNPDNAQMKTMMKVMFFMILCTSFFMTSALNVYWITTNLFTIVQNILVKRGKEKV